MKPLFALLFLALAFPLSAPAQHLDLTLRDKRFPVDRVDFRVASVRDARPDTSGIGTAYTGLFNKRKTVRLQPGAAAAFETYLQRHLRTTDEPRPVHLRIEALEVDEQRTLLNETARALLRVAFYVEHDGRQGRVFEAEAYAERIASDVTSWHEPNLRQVLASVVEEFAATDWQAAAPVFDVEPDSPAAARAAEPAAAQVLPALPPTPVRSYAVLVNPTAGTHGRGAGLAVYAHDPAARGWTTPYSLVLQIVAAENTEEGLEGVFHSFAGSIGLYRRVEGAPLALLGDLQIPVGTERIDHGSEQTTRFFGGLRVSQSVLLVPGERGVVLGLGAYGSRLLGSDLYPRDLGVQLHLGWRF